MAIIGFHSITTQKIILRMHHEGIAVKTIARVLDEPMYRIEIFLREHEAQVSKPGGCYSAVCRELMLPPEARLSH